MTTSSNASLGPCVCLLLIAVCLNFAGAQTGDVQKNDVSSALSSEVHGIATKQKLGNNLSITGYQDQIKRLYESANFAPLWIKGDQLTPQATYLIEALRTSRLKGLNPRDYDAEDLAAQSKSLHGASPAAQASFDASLTLATMRYISDLRIGRINPKHLKFGIDVKSKKYNLPEFIAQVASAGDIQSVLDQIEPPYIGYRRIESALKQYLDLAAKGDGPKVPAGTKTIAPGDAYAGTPQLADKLRLLGDLPPDAPFNSYNGALVDAVKHFQARNGLTTDGKLDAATLRELNTSLSERVQQIDDALERWRWLPAEFQQPPVLVNIPEFRLRAFSENHQLALSMNVVVGKAAPTQTPVFTDDIQFIVFRPYWNVPPGILRRSVIPGILNKPGYIARERFEVTDSSGQLVSASNDDLVAGLRSGKYSIRQKPGPSNALGLIKFMFPNSHSVYLHSTPSTELFAKSRRDFSSGCIRVEKPAELAAFLLRNQPDGGQPWTVALAQSAMDSGKDNRQVNLKVQIPVLILYVTAVAEEDGTVHFFDDIYGHDKRLNALLAKGPPYP